MIRTLFYLALFITICSCKDEEVIPMEMEDDFQGFEQYSFLSIDCTGPFTPLINPEPISVRSKENPEEGYLLAGFFKSDLPLDIDGRFEKQPFEHFTLVEVFIQGQRLYIETQESDLTSFQKCNYDYAKI
jgi:hypothetical protein